MNAEHRQNLLTLARYLMEGRCCYRFSMDVFFDEKVCGTVACAVGHGPDATGISIDRRREEWHEYSERVFGLYEMTLPHLWCFGGYWWKVDNTARGAGQRILWLLRHGLPHNVECQMLGQHPLCYTAITLDEPISPAREITRTTATIPVTAGRPA